MIARPVVLVEGTDRLDPGALAVGLGAGPAACCTSLAPAFSAASLGGNHNWYQTLMAWLQ